MDRTLTRDDVTVIVERLLTVQTKSKPLGRLLIPTAATVESIHQQSSDPQECLFSVFDEFVRQLEPRPTWRVVMKALRNPIIGEPQLAQEIESELSTQQMGEKKAELARKEAELTRKEAELTRKEGELARKETRREAELARKEAELARKEAELTRKAGELDRKEAGLTRAEETVRREQQEIQEMRQRESELVQVKDRKIALLEQQLRQKEHLQIWCFGVFLSLLLSLLLGPYIFVHESPPHYIIHASGPGLTTATVNQSTHVLLELTAPRLVTARIESLSNATHTVQSLDTPTGNWWLYMHFELQAVKSSSQYKMSYTPVSRGQHKLHIQVNGREINGSPFTVTVYPDPRQLGHPVRNVTGMYGPYGMTFNSHQEMIVSESQRDRLSIFDIQGRKIKTFGNDSGQINRPVGTATDNADNIYVSSEHKLHKFTRSGELIKSIGQEGRKNGEFSYPCGVAVYENHVYVCDSKNYRIQVFDLDLKFVRIIGSRGKGIGKFDTPWDVSFDTAGNMYVAEIDSNRVQVLDTSGQFIRAFGQEDEGTLYRPTGLHIADKYVYVSDLSGRIVVYETSGKFITSLRRKDWMGNGLYCITSCARGFIYVCDYNKHKIWIL